MEGIINVFTFCILCGTMILCIGLIIHAVLIWLKPEEKRKQKFMILAVISFMVLCAWAYIYWRTKISRGDVNSNDAIPMSALLFDFSLAAIKMLMLAAIMGLVAALLIIVILCLYKGLRTLMAAKSATGDKDKASYEISSKNTAFYNAVKSPEVALIIVGGLISLFLILPFLVGESKGDYFETWTNGVTKIANSFSDDASTKDNVSDYKETIQNSSEDSYAQKETETLQTSEAKTDQSSSNKFYVKHLATYALVYIILFGTGLAVVKILRSLIVDSFRRTRKVSLIDTYANPIAFLAVGVSLLWMIQADNFNDLKDWELLWELIKSVGTVIFVAALLILTLEIIRLLLDMRQKLIRKEAKYIFISLVGKSVLFLFDMLDSIYNALNNMVGGDSKNRLSKIDKKLKKKIISTMNSAIKKEKKSSFEEDDNEKFEEDDNEKTKKTKITKITFNPFEERVTKK